MSVLEIWGAEYQENNALLIKPESADMFLAMAARENCPAALLGKVNSVMFAFREREKGGGKEDDGGG